MIKVDDKLPAGKLQEFIEVEGDGCSVGPKVSRSTRRRSPSSQRLRFPVTTRSIRAL